MTVPFSRSLAGLFIGAACLTTQAVAQEVVTFKVPLEVQGFDPAAEVSMSVACLLIGSQHQTYGIKQVWINLTQGAYSGTVDVPVTHIAGSPKPISWDCQFGPWKIRYPWQTTSTICYFGNIDVTWPCFTGCFNWEGNKERNNACMDRQSGDFQ